MKSAGKPALVQKSILNYMPRKDAETTASNAPFIQPRATAPAPLANSHVLQTIHETIHPGGKVERLITNYVVPQVGGIPSQQPSPRVGEKRERPQPEVNLAEVTNCDREVHGRQQFTYSQKWRLLQLADANGYNYVERSKNVPHGTLTTWAKKRKEIETAVARGLGDLVKIQPLAVYKALFEELYDAYVGAREMFFAVTVQWARSWCCAKNEEFAKLPIKRQYENLQTFKRHYNLSVRRRSGLTQFLPMNSKAGWTNFSPHYGKHS